MDRYGNIDFMKPAPNQNDYRTSTYRGHIKQSDYIGIPPPFILKDVCTKFTKVTHWPTGQSEFQREYTWKPTDPDMVRNPRIKSLQHMKGFENSRLRHPPKPLPRYCSDYRQNFHALLKDYEEPAPEVKVFGRAKAADPQPINRLQPGYAKLLDPSATTSNLAYKKYPLTNLGIGTPDAITYWNTQKFKYNVAKVEENMCDKYKAAMCPKRYKEFRNLTEWVPHGGQSSTTKSSYVGQTAILYNISHIKNLLTAVTTPEVKPGTENMMYGKGDRSQRYVP